MLTSLGVGGAERQVLALAERMSARGHAVALVVLRPHHNDDLSTHLEVVHLNLGKTAGGWIRAIREGGVFLRSFRPDVMHSHNFHGNLLARVLRMFHRRFILISTIHNVYEGGWLRMAAYGLTDRLADLTTAVSAAAAERYIRIRAVRRARCVVLTNGIDTAEFAPDTGRRAAMRDEMGVTGEFVWITVGRIAPAKDYPNLLRAFEVVHAAQPAAQLWAVGEAGVSSDPRYAVLAAERGTMKQVRWLGLRRDTAALLDAADGFVLGSAWEGMPLALGEAMAMEKPVVATDVGGVRELVGDAGSMVPARDPGALGAAMRMVMETSLETRLANGVRARERICRSFSMEAKADEWEKLYGSLLSRTM